MPPHDEPESGRETFLDPFPVVTTVGGAEDTLMALAPQAGSAGSWARPWTQYPTSGRSPPSAVSTAGIPSFFGTQVAPSSSDRNTPTAEMPTHMLPLPDRMR